MTHQNRDEKTVFEHQPKGVIVSIAPSLTARDLARQFVAQDASRAGGVQPAQRALARKLRVTPYTIRNLIGGGLKRVCVDLFAELHAEQIRRLSASLAKAEHELHVARSIGLDQRSTEFRSVEAAAEAARQAIGGRS